MNSYLNAVDFYIKEAQSVHETLDEMGVQRDDGDGLPLSMSQRVKAMHDLVLQLNVAVKRWQIANA